MQRNAKANRSLAKSWGGKIIDGKIMAEPDFQGYFLRITM